MTDDLEKRLRIVGERFRHEGMLPLATECYEVADSLASLRSDLGEARDNWEGAQACFDDSLESYKRLTARHGELLERDARMEKVLGDVLVGGNHLANALIRNLGPGFPTHYPPTMAPLDALEKIGAGDTHDIWCCWASIMGHSDFRVETRSPPLYSKVGRSCGKDPA